ncbi:hypothetical protein [Maribacter sp. Asnod2-G09]|uniref:hypothetical protein n=1 Tax=Maribacter sp. Asnod2-G09 TaxID=3160577 RepID=UPI00386FAF42
MKIVQIIGSQKKEFELINETELHIKEKYLLSSTEKTIDIEYIGHQKSVVTHSRKGLNIIGIFFVFIAITCWIVPFFEETPNEKLDILVWGGLFMLLLGFVCFKAPMNNTITLSGGYELRFFLDSPSRKEVEIFVDGLINLSKEKIKNKYSRIDADLPEETFMNQLSWLLNNKFISEKEYIEKKNEYKISRLTR